MMLDPRRSALAGVPKKHGHPAGHTIIAHVTERSQCVSRLIAGARLAKIKAHVAEGVGPCQVVQPERRLLEHWVQLPAACIARAHAERQAMMSCVATQLKLRTPPANWSLSSLLAITDFSKQPDWTQNTESRVCYSDSNASCCFTSQWPSQDTLLCRLPAFGSMPLPYCATCSSYAAASSAEDNLRCMIT